MLMMLWWVGRVREVYRNAKTRLFAGRAYIT